jgi:protein tyrosine phosphatase (PTP) superfamily phosphohydrolase (DUF442 family)
MKGLRLFLPALLLAFVGFARLSAQNQAAPGASTNQVPASVHPLKAAGIENFYQLSDKMYSGSAPEGEAAFAALKALGIKTIITVDGAKPDVETAKKFGLQYVHLPIGYDGVPTNQAVRLVKAVETLDGPFYIHCHHGMHRGPAGAAVVCMGVEGWSAEQADAWLHLAGTATNYAGLYKSVAQFHPPTAEALKSVSANFPDKADVSPLADQMIQIDGRFDGIKLIKAADYQQPLSHPDLAPEHEALLLHEQFKELLRSPIMEKHDENFRAKLTDTEEAANSFHLAMLAQPLDSKKADAAFQRINESCAACHKAYRN